MAPQPTKAESNSNAIVDLEAGPGDCPICMEPAEWVAVGPCGHGEVCVSCAVRLRFHERNWRCCMCRSFCPTVVITRNATGGGTGGQPQEGAEAAFPKPPLASGGAGQAGRRLSYHNGMAAYFDDEGQYEKVRRMCLESAQRSRPGAGNRSSHAWPQGQDSPTETFILSLILHGVVTIIGCGIGVLVAVHLFGNWGQRIPVVIACVCLSHAVSYVLSKFILHRTGS